MRTVRVPRRIGFGFVTLATTWALLATGAAEPKLKDSRAGVQPKEATLTASVTPNEAKPGDTVKFSVTAKVAFGWHIYGYNKTQPDDGPRVTQFDLFDRAGLTVKGDWTPDRTPSQKKDSAFPDLPFVEYHEDEVTWSVEMVVPKDAVPGKKSIRCQAGYQLCSDQTCSFPGRWSLPAAELTIVANKTKPRGTDRALNLVTEALLIPSLVLFADAPAALKPQLKDSRPAAKPKNAVLTSSVSPNEAKPGDKVTYTVTAKMKPKSHIFKLATKGDPEDGPKFTVFDFFDPAGLTLQGDWTPSRPPIKKPDASFDKIPFLEFYEEEVTWSHTLIVPADAGSGKKTLRCQAGYMVCDERGCSYPGQWTLPDVELTILGMGAAAAKTETKPTPPAVEAKPAAVAETKPNPTPAAVPKAEAEVAETKPNPTPAAAPKAEAGVAETKPPVATSEVEKKATGGLLGFLLFCAGGGLLALLMPCVWPMVPITVNFFVKQGQKKKGSTTKLAVAYCLAIIGIFTAVGLLFSILFGPESLSKLGNNPWLNFGVAGLFLVFGLSLLGLFEISLPNFLLNASAQGEGKGGIIGVMFMALTLTITSFTCTFPVVGGLIVMAAGGDYFYPIIGMATFASVIALPFFLLALSPGLLAKMPKSGDWMNAVKVVGGLVEIGAAFKFINTAECVFVVPSDAIFNAYAVLTIWVVLALVCGIYLLGLFRTDHDHDAVKVGPGRMILGSMFLFLALFMTPALFGRPPQSKLWFMIVGLLPADASDLRVPVGGGGGGGDGGDAEHAVKAVSTDPKQAEREQKSVHGVTWGMSFEAGLAEAKASNKPIFIDFTGVNCANCRVMEQEVLPRPEVVKLLKNFVTIQLYTDIVPINSITPDQRRALASSNLDRLIAVANEVSNPLYLALSPTETVLGVKAGKMSSEEFVQLLKDALAKHNEPAKVARNP